MVLPCAGLADQRDRLPGGQVKVEPGQHDRLPVPEPHPGEGTRRPLAAVGSETGAGGSATDGSSSSTPEIFSSADAAPWKEL